MSHRELHSGGVEVSEVSEVLEVLEEVSVMLGEMSGEVLEADAISGWGMDREVRSEHAPINVPDAVLSATGGITALSLVGRRRAWFRPGRSRLHQLRHRYRH
jgi:hypothetical protein